MRLRIAVVSFAIIGAVIPALYACLTEFPTPAVHDEFSYLLAADTFVNGRVSNPAPDHPQSFEAPHLLVTPTYASKYPPMQGFFLAVGQVLFGNPAFGIWVSCGFAAVSFFWMFAGWQDFRWAILGAALAILFLGVNHYWAQSFWGGMVAAGGGALFFGGLRRVYERATVGASVLMTLGGIVLVNSRPFEGTAMMVPGLIWLAIWSIKGGKRAVAEKFQRVVLPGALLTGIALSGMAYYNHSVTGDPLRLPYQEHQSQYFSTPLFVFQSPVGSELQGNHRLRQLYDFLSISAPLRDLEYFGLPRSTYLFPIYAILYLLIFLPFSFLGPPLGLLLYAGIMLLRKDRWALLIICSILFTIFCMSFASYWDLLHYAAPLTAGFIYLAVESLRAFRLRASTPKEARLVNILLAVAIVGSIVFQSFASSTSSTFEAPNEETFLKSFSDGEEIVLAIESRATDLKPYIEMVLGRLPDRRILFVSYHQDFNLHDDIVFNASDLNNAQVLWANDLGQEPNLEVINKFGPRTAHLVHLKGASMIIKPVKSAENLFWETEQDQGR